MTLDNQKVDLLDMTFAVTQSHLGRKSDIIRRDLMCLNPQYRLLL